MSWASVGVEVIDAMDSDYPEPAPNLEEPEIFGVAVCTSAFWARWSRA